MHAHHAQVQGVVLVHGALAEQRVHHRRAQLLRQRGDGLARPGDDGPVAHVEQRAGGLGEQPRRFAAEAEVRIALVKRVLRNAVEGHE